MYQRGELIRMNQKAQFEIRKTIFWTVVMTIVTILIFVFALQISEFKNKMVKTPEELRAEMISLRFTNSPDCFAYQESERAYPGIIDLTKFKESNLINCYPVADKKDYNFGLKLQKEKKELRTKKYYLNNRDFTLYKTVLVKKGEKLIPDVLEIAVQVKI